MAKIDKGENNKPFKLLKLIENLLFTLFVMVMSILILITAQSRFTGREPALFNHRLYIVDSGSMSPTINLDSMIVVRELEAENIRERDIITYYGHSDTTRVTHRVVEVLGEGESFITRGDANNTNDPMALDGGKVIGKVIFTIPFIGRIFRFLSTTKGIASLVIIGILWVVIPKMLNDKGGKYKDNEHPVGLDDSQEVGN